ncbi:hypothetical protein GJ744_003860 [Endocarpon pusillum]|uniref:Glutathione S-transferase n=1 Tax=Endocarpon pusillum TaxID=364733 RepID=A0A8H7AP83_9EURO|nr:hypothetical protein GJ744_003860 [Endocarpon pusillum]
MLCKGVGMIPRSHPFAHLLNAAKLLPRRKPISERRDHYATIRCPSARRQTPALSVDAPGLVKTKIFSCTRSFSLSSQSPSSDRTLYFRGHPNAFKCFIVLEELGLRYEIVQFEGDSDAEKIPGFLDKNTTLRTPALRDGDISVFGFGGITAYLVDRYDPSASLSYPRDTPEYYTMQSWFLNQVSRSKARLGPKKSPQGIIRSFHEGERMIKELDERLSHVEWVAGDRYTLADIGNYGWTRGTPALRTVDLAAFPAFKGWVERIEGRKAVQKAIDTQTRLLKEWKEREEGKEGKGGQGSAAPE